MEACAGRVVLGRVVRALRVYAPLCMKDITLTMFAAAMASGRSPSKLTISTRRLLGGGIGVMVGVGVAVAGGGVMVGARVCVSVGRGAPVGGPARVDAAQASDTARSREKPSAAGSLLAVRRPTMIDLNT
jgi:hypothetical protein